MGAKVGAEQADQAVASAADGALPLDAKLGRLVDVDFGNQAFDIHLRAPSIELFNDCAQLPVLRL